MIQGGYTWTLGRWGQIPTSDRTEAQFQLPGGGAPSSRGRGRGVWGWAGAGFPGVRTADWTTYSAPPRTSSSVCDENQSLEWNHKPVHLTVTGIKVFNYTTNRSICILKEILRLFDLKPIHLYVTGKYKKENK